MEAVNIYTNRNVIPGDKGPSSASGLRLGTYAMTSRGLVDTDVQPIVEFINRALALVPQVNSKLEKQNN